MGRQRRSFLRWDVRCAPPLLAAIHRQRARVSEATFLASLSSGASVRLDRFQPRARTGRRDRVGMWRSVSEPWWGWRGCRAGCVGVCVGSVGGWRGCRAGCVEVCVGSVVGLARTWDGWAEVCRSDLSTTVDRAATGLPGHARGCAVRGRCRVWKAFLRLPACTRRRERRVTTVWHVRARIRSARRT